MRVAFGLLIEQNDSNAIRCDHGSERGGDYHNKWGEKLRSTHQNRFTVYFRSIASLVIFFSSVAVCLAVLFTYALSSVKLPFLCLFIFSVSFQLFIQVLIYWKHALSAKHTSTAHFLLSVLCSTSFSINYAIEFFRRVSCVWPQNQRPTIVRNVWCQILCGWMTLIYKPTHTRKCFCIYVDVHWRSYIADKMF